MVWDFQVVRSAGRELIELLRLETVCVPHGSASPQLLASLPLVLLMRSFIFRGQTLIFGGFNKSSAAEFIHLKSAADVPLSLVIFGRDEVHVKPRVSEMSNFSGKKCVQL